ncbi:glycosyltransferase family protein [Actinopolymorpha pittospori]|uniref:Glycosyltransferase n=1 Tax=Actinopolymorpha pittospori TaxID=648752 RepID=A0A927MUZ5_9ACTN|nr:glycosyltransferase [Actinopolymorpha pittospori]MBE1606704.1 putative glycosyltransferase [Actinopolymorpha pittospori]
MVQSADEARLLIYSQDGLGLGHQRRTTHVANEFLRAHPGASVLTVSDSPLGRFFASSGTHDYLKLPSLRRAGPGLWRPLSLASPFDDVLALRRDLIRVAAQRFRPDILLVDHHMPNGLMGELLPALEAVRTTPARVVLGLRDILDAPETVQRRWRLEGAFEAIERHYDDVLVFGSREVYDLAAEYDWPEVAARRLRYCGYVGAAPSPTSAAEIRRIYLREETGPLVLALGGGGADAYPLFDALLRSVPALLARRRCTFVLITGPLLPKAERLRLLSRARDLPVHVLTRVDDATPYVGAADLVVAMAGYNTAVEILSQQTPALLVPRSGPSAEQQMRARSFAERGWVHWLPPDQLAAQALAAAAATILAGSAPTPASAPDLGGREVVVERLRSGLGHVRQAAGALVEG